MVPLLCSSFFAFRDKVLFLGTLFSDPPQLIRVVEVKRSLRQRWVIFVGILQGKPVLQPFRELPRLKTVFDDVCLSVLRFAQEDVRRKWGQ